MQIETFSQGLSRLIDETASFEPIAIGFVFTEGPVWSQKESCLYFSDIPSGRIHRWSPSDGVTVYRDPSFKANGLTLDREGRLISCEHVGRRVSRQEADGTLTALAKDYDGGRLNSPNDVVVASDGSIYFTDPDSGITHPRSGVLAPREQPVNGVYRISPQGDLTRVADDFEHPNGLAFSPDEKTLYVDDTRLKHIRAFAVLADGSLGVGRVFAALEGDEAGAVDGMKVDVEGNVYCTGPGGIHIFDAAGVKLGRLKIPPAGPSNVGWGGADWRTLYVTWREAVCSIRMKVPGIPVGPE
ncbi:MAG: SMP-30/gluconolactonase/LRE family protein [Chloroflexi bacterium]|nr:SMP-30/gluconolactonase/LRE family protein [Chloroflexota bacterium]